MKFKALFATLFVSPFLLWADSIPDNDAVRDTIAQINHMNWVVTKINHYNNALVLEEEYKKKYENDPGIWSVVEDD